MGHAAIKVQEERGRGGGGVMAADHSLCRSDCFAVCFLSVSEPKHAESWRRRALSAMPLKRQRSRTELFSLPAQSASHRSEKGPGRSESLVSALACSFFFFFQKPGLKSGVEAARLSNSKPPACF